MSLSFTVLGCGSSGGVPRLDGDWGQCDPTNPKNRRSRCSLLVTRKTDAGETAILIDTSPDMRAQLIDAQRFWLDAVLYTHDHADQTHGIDDIRAMVYSKRKRVEVWMDAATSETLTNRFGYCFTQAEGSGYPAILNDNRIETPFRDITIQAAGGDIIATPFRQIHGAMGITNEYPIMRHMMNLESVITYEGTHDVHLLITGFDITGENAFK